MKQGFSVIDITIIIGLILLAYLGYSQYLDSKTERIIKNSDYPLQHSNLENTKSAASTSANQPLKNQAAAQKTAIEKIQIAETDKTITPASKKGYYENITYFYQISFPESWPIKIRSAENVSLGTVPPKNGQGAITIEISTGENNELEQAKAEARKYPGLISITEEPIALAGINGNKITLNNLMTKTKTINILLKKSNLNYILKYGEESSEFVDQVNKALATFKFTE